MKKIENFPEKSELPNFILPMIIDVLNLSHGFWVEKNADIRAGSLSCLTGSPLDSVIPTMLLTCAQNLPYS